MTGSVNAMQTALSQWSTAANAANITASGGVNLGQTAIGVNAFNTASVLAGGNVNVNQTAIASGTAVNNLSIGTTGGGFGAYCTDCPSFNGTLDPKGGRVAIGGIPGSITIGGVTRPIKDKKTLDKLNQQLAQGKSVKVVYFDPKRKVGQRHIQVTYTPEKCPDGSIKRDICGNICVKYSCGKPYSPLMMDLNGDGIKAAAGNKAFDIDADGQADQISKMGNDDVMLVADMDGDGVSGKDASEAFGEYTTAKAGDKKGQKNYNNGFEALKAFAQAKLGSAAVADGKLDATELATLENQFGLRVSDNNGNQTKLSDKGITEVSLAFAAGEETVDSRGNNHGETGSFVRNGQKRGITDVYFVKQ